MSLVRSCVEYCSVIWTHVTKANLIKLESVQRRGTRFILSTGFGEPGYEERLIASKLLPLSYRREMLDCQFLLKAKSGAFGEQIWGLVDIRPHWINPRLDTHATKLRYQPAHTETYNHFFTRRIAHIWNKLPDQIRTILFNRQSPRFKRSITQHKPTTPAHG